MKHTHTRKNTQAEAQPTRLLHFLLHNVFTSVSEESPALLTLLWIYYVQTCCFASCSVKGSPTPWRPRAVQNLPCFSRSNLCLRAPRRFVVCCLCFAWTHFIKWEYCHKTRTVSSVLWRSMTRILPFLEELPQTSPNQELLFLQHTSGLIMDGAATFCSFSIKHTFACQ